MSRTPAYIEDHGTPHPDNGKIIYEEELSTIVDNSFMRYARSVLRSRAIPTAEDGLKPSQRRVLVAMNDLHLNPTASTIKSAKIAGTCSGDYHPHGESIVYPTMVRLAQDWIMRYPLVHGQGNWGNIGGAPAAAMRYTEAKLSKYGAMMLADLSSDVVPYVPNYDEKLQEPVLLPSLLPNLIVNGGAGIAVGVATKLAPHNLTEITSLIKAYINNPNLTTDEILAIVPGPDFPNGGVLRGQEGVRSYYETGRGSLIVDGIFEIEASEKGMQQIVVTELPYGASSSLLLRQIDELVKAEKLKGVHDYKDLSDRKIEGVKLKVVIWLTKNTNASLVLNQILKSTCLRSLYSVNQTVLIDGKVIENATMLQLIETFVNHRKVVLTKKFEAERTKIAARLHILEGLIRVSQNIRAVVALIQDTDSPELAAEALIKAGYVDTDLQAKAVLAITLSKLTKMETNALINEQTKLTDRHEWLNHTLGSEKRILKIVAKEQEDLAKHLGDARRTKIGPNLDEITAEDLIPEEQVVISLTQDGYIKRIPTSAYRVQGRGGKGVQHSGGNKAQEESATIFVASTHETILFFTNKGLAYRKKGYDIPLGSRTSKGTHLANLLALSAEEHVTSTIPLKTMDQDGYLVMVTKNGLIKRSLIRVYDTSYKTKGLQAIKLDDGDELSFVQTTDGKKDIWLVTSHGKAVRYAETTVRCTGRVTSGVQAMNIAKDDQIAQALVLSSVENPELLVLTSLGYGKKSNASLYRCYSGRYAKGINTIDTVKADRNGLIVSACVVKEDDTLMVLTTNGKIIQLPISSIRSTGRATMGVRVVTLDIGDSIGCTTVIANGMNDLLKDED